MSKSKINLVADEGEEKTDPVPDNAHISDRTEVSPTTSNGTVADS